MDDLKRHAMTHSTNPKVCPQYAIGKCEFGASGKMGGNCPFPHPRKCIYFQANMCKKGDKCTFYHPTKKSTGLTGERLATSDYMRQGKHFGISNFGQSNNMAHQVAFLGQGFMEMKQMIAKLQQDQNNNQGLWPRI